MLTIPVIRFLPELSDGIVAKVNIDKFQIHSDDHNERSDAQ